jgi:hypothetical protein
MSNPNSGSPLPHFAIKVAFVRSFFISNSSVSAVKTSPHYQRITMNSCSGLKRSMPCTDLISMNSSSKDYGLIDTLRPFASKRLRRFSGKRQHLISLSLFEDISSLSSAEENPATAALEKTLASFQEDKDMQFEDLLESDIAGTKQLTCVVYFFVRRLHA